MRNRVEQEKYLWQRLGETLAAEVSNAERNAADLMQVIIEKMRVEDARTGGTSAMPDPKLVDELINAYVRQRFLVTHVTPAFEKARRAAVHYNPDPLYALRAPRR